MKKVLPMVALGLLLVMVIILWTDHRQKKEEAKEVLALEEELRPLNVRRQKIKKQLEEIAEAYEAGRRPKATTQILFTQLEPRVYELCYPIMKEHEFTGVLALSEQQLPGAENCMTEEQFEELLDAGWSVCVRFDDSAQLNTQWNALKKKLKNFNIDAPTTVYFADGIYDSGLDATIEKCGFTIAIHHGEEGLPLVQKNDETGIWHLGAVGIRGKEPRLRFMEAIDGKANIITLVGFSLTEEMYVEKSFRSLLDTCKDYEVSEDLLLGSPEDARAHFQSRTVESGEAEKQAYLDKKAKLEAKLEEVEKQIEGLQ